LRGGVFVLRYQVHIYKIAKAVLFSIYQYLDDLRFSGKVSAHLI